MAIDWNQEVSLSTVRSLLKHGPKGAGDGGAYPTKTTMNLYQDTGKKASMFSVGVTAVVLVLAIGLFLKFGVLDQLSALSQKQAELSRQQSNLSTARAAAADYNDIKDAYDGFVMRYGADAGDAIAVLDMVERHVMNRTTVTSIALDQGTLTLTLYDVPLKTVGELAKDLESQDMVASVNVSCATTENADAQNTVSTLVISLAGSQAEEG